MIWSPAVSGKVTVVWAFASTDVVRGATWLSIKNISPVLEDVVFTAYWKVILPGFASVVSSSSTESTVFEPWNPESTLEVSSLHPLVPQKPEHEVWNSDGNSSNVVSTQYPMLYSIIVPG